MTRRNAIDPSNLAEASRITAGLTASVDAFNDLFCSVGWTNVCSIYDRHSRIEPITVKLNRSGRPHVASLRSAARRAVEAYNALP